MKSPFGDMTMRVASDGKGHVRNELDGPRGKTISVYDYPAGQYKTAIENQKMIMVMDIPPQKLKPITDEQSAKIAGAKSLGAKTFDGHPCHGWEADNVKAKTQTWIGDDTHYLVHSESSLKEGKQIVSLKSWSDKAPADLQTLPSGYKEVRMPKPPAH
jgi:hypothetical protein